MLDPAGANVPSAVISALNVNTGVKHSAVSNTSGVYQFASLPPGDYRFSAEKEGFKRLDLDVTTLRVGDRLQQNLTLQVGTATETVEVASNSDSVNYLNTTQGGLLNTQRVQELPVSRRDAMELVGTQPGLVLTSSGANINGARTDFLNVTLDGVNIMDNAVLTSVTGQLISTTVDRVAEVHVITSPVDAEYGRGSGQVQLISRSGTNTFHGSVYDFAHNTALNANTWANNRSGVPRNVEILNQTGARVDGPIRKNKTFFFALFEASLDRTKTSVTNTVLTSTARQGLFRFYPGVQSANANASNPSVDLAGNPVSPRGATGDLQTVSLFGRDPNRLTPDAGAVAQTLSLLPLPNSFLTGDGLNTAGYIWRRGASDDIYSLDFRLDHNFNERHRLTFSYNRDSENSPNGNDAQAYPTSPGGAYQQISTVGSLALISTLSPALVNEARVGVQRAHLDFQAPWTATPAGTGILPSINGIPYILSLNGVTSPLASSDPQGRITPVYQYSDKVSWLHGRHALKAGVELRFLSEFSYHAFNVLPRVTLGAGNVGVQGINTISGIGANSTLAGNLLTTLSGSVGGLVEQFYASGGDNPTYAPLNNEQHWNQTREWGAYIQDDFRVRSNLTLNLGLRWDYYGVPHERYGRMVDLVGGSESVFGISGDNFGALFQPGNMPGSLSQFELVGANSPHPDVLPWAKRYRNFAPAIGLSWSLPWLGANKSVFRAGYSIAYEHGIMALLNQLFGYGAPGVGATAVHHTVHLPVVRDHLVAAADSIHSATGHDPHQRQQQLHAECGHPGQPSQAALYPELERIAGARGRQRLRGGCPLRRQQGNPPDSGCQRQRGEHLRKRHSRRLQSHRCGRQFAAAQPDFPRTQRAAGGRGGRREYHRLAGRAAEHHATGVPAKQQRRRLRQLSGLQYVRHGNSRRAVVERRLAG
ncbi:MAG: TonB-dependent receptor [Ignavibacteriota bacterium]